MCEYVFLSIVLMANCHVVLVTAST